MRSAHSKILMLIVFTGVICGLIVVLTAYAAELRCDNNELIKQNEVLQTEVDTLDINLKSANSVDHIEKIATDKLGMVYPQEDECVYMSSAKAPEKNLAMTIRENAYN